jgi:hypothetical protein
LKFEEQESETAESRSLNKLRRFRFSAIETSDHGDFSASVLYLLQILQLFDHANFDIHLWRTEEKMFAEN